MLLMSRGRHEHERRVYLNYRPNAKRLHVKALLRRALELVLKLNGYVAHHTEHHCELPNSHK